MKSRKKEPTERRITSNNVCAPDYFEATAESSEWGRRCKAFVQAMEALDRVVTLGFDGDTGKLYLTSIEDAR